jgi:hypothetical protein
MPRLLDGTPTSSVCKTVALTSFTPDVIAAAREALIRCLVGCNGESPRWGFVMNDGD